MSYGLSLSKAALHKGATFHSLGDPLICPVTIPGSLLGKEGMPPAYILTYFISGARVVTN